MMFDCSCGGEEGTRRVSSSVDVAVLSYPVIRLGWTSVDIAYLNINLKTNQGKWEEIREELCISNVIQRDSVMFANKLHPCLGDLAMANENEVSPSEDNL